MNGQPVKIEKQEEELQIVWGAVYVPGVPDAHGHTMTKEEVQKAYLRFAMRGDYECVDIMHDNVRFGAKIVEMFLSRPGDPDFPVEGTWVAGTWMPDDAWQLVKKGVLNGYSIEALAYEEEIELDIVTGVLQGKTYKHEDAEVFEPHEHEYEVIYDDEGRLVGGRTSVYTDSKGRPHFHVIKRGTITEDTLDHRHKFATAEKLLGIS